MKIVNFLKYAAILLISCTALGENTTTTQPQISKQNYQMAQKGCQKPIGYFPTPSKLMCLLTALGLSDKEAKPKALALIFNVCHGRVLQPPPGLKPKAYQTLGACLSDPNEVILINSQLKAQGLPEIKVVNTDVLGTTSKPVGTAPSSSPTMTAPSLPGPTTTSPR